MSDNRPPGAAGGSISEASLVCAADKNERRIMEEEQGDLSVIYAASKSVYIMSKTATTCTSGLRFFLRRSCRADDTNRRNQIRSGVKVTSTLIFTSRSQEHRGLGLTIRDSRGATDVRGNVTRLLVGLDFFLEALGRDLGDLKEISIGRRVLWKIIVLSGSRGWTRVTNLSSVHCSSEMN